MDKPTALDTAHASMEAAPEDTSARLAFYHRLAGSELYLLLESEPSPGSDQITPQVFDVEGDSYALAFDTAERLAGFAGAPAPYAALPGRALAGMLATGGIGLGLNLDVAPSAILIPPEALTWLRDTLGGDSPGAATTRPDMVQAPGNLPPSLLQALDSALARMAGLAQQAFLAGAVYPGGVQGHILMFIGAIPEAEEALTRAVSEALVFSGIEAGALDVGFAAPDSALADRLGRVGLRFDLPEVAGRVERVAPGSDPEKPPKLR
ncbi:SseB family protein [Rhodobacteraceae bacterium KMM 6894]|nr:SseB family protein [Rhodobacteraceae bacterium KMM 6894]